jgi:cobalt/nickel transport protein
MRAAPAACLAAALAASPASAHFLQLIPSADVLPEGGAVDVALTFTHPVDGGPVMAMERPVRFGMVRRGVADDLAAALAPVTVEGAAAWTARVDLRDPGAAVLFVEPAPYWEPAEGKFIVHYARVVVDPWASGEGWDASAGLPVEIEPLTRPTGLWTGNLFRGIVRANGQPVPFAEIEVEFVNDGRVTPPNEAFITQVVKADASGAFAYAMPLAGWWGFAALTEAPRTMTAPDGSQASVEAGALFWVKVTDMAAAR